MVSLCGCSLYIYIYILFFWVLFLWVNFVIKYLCFIRNGLFIISVSEFEKIFSFDNGFLLVFSSGVHKIVLSQSIFLFGFLENILIAFFLFFAISFDFNL